ncbi:MAG: hypothetical protein PHQ75_03640 [Thermoguttaceae bacterium]|nr:hypothetical protein [Thermoguttaceae bacterium]
MSSENNNTESTLGFLSVTGSVKQGLLGGLLVLNCFGRPVEFHCTAPVRANRAPEILYGNTLQPFLSSEQIAPALVSKVETSMFAVLTDCPFVLSGAPLLPVPLIFAFSRIPGRVPAATRSQEEMVERERFGSFDEFPFIPGFDSDQWTVVAKGNTRLALIAQEEAAQRSFETQLDHFLEAIDPCEPFERIRLAVEEAQKAG